ncbi:MAG: hypothetical protein WD042_10050 [Phycisphaeraceae bacterium]
MSDKNDESSRGERSMGPWYWTQHPSIYEHILAHVKAGDEGLTEGGETLPDQAREGAGAMFQWAPGAQDGVTTHHRALPAPQEEAEAVAAVIRRFCGKPVAENRQLVHDTVLGRQVAVLVDALLRALITAGTHADRIHDLGKSLVTQSPDREPVKLGIALLGILRSQFERSILMTLGRHDEFTLFSAAALSNDPDVPMADRWELAKQVHGWGRVQAVKWLGKPEVPDIKDWLLREGYRNTVMIEYLAYTCAVNGDLRGALAQDVVDDGLLASAGDLIKTLILSTAAKGMDSYSDGAEVMESYLRHLTRRLPRDRQYQVVHVMERWLIDRHMPWEQLARYGWSHQRGESLLMQCAEVLAFE